MSGRKEVPEVTIQQLREDPGKWIRLVAKGERITIVAGRTRVPVARLIPYLSKEDWGDQGEEQEGTDPGE
jgi:antitoxin (DNA-binding transcriptional repressor) of toxin-antitoxin stability system